VSDYQRVPHNEALYVKIAKILSQDSDLVARYRAAVARLLKDRDEWVSILKATLLLPFTRSLKK
jgi:hypothetical protein